MMVTCLQSVGVTWLSQKSWSHNNFIPKENTSEDVFTSGMFRTRNESNLMLNFTFKISTKFCILLAIKFMTYILIILVHPTNVSGHGTKTESQKGWGLPILTFLWCSLPTMAFGPAQSSDRNCSRRASPLFSSCILSLCASTLMDLGSCVWLWLMKNCHMAAVSKSVFMQPGLL